MNKLVTFITYSKFKTLVLCGLVGFLSTSAIARKNDLTIHPPFWYTDLNAGHLQLLVHGEGIAAYTEASTTSDWEVVHIKPATSPDYLFIDMKLPMGIQPGTKSIMLKNGRKKIQIEYEILQKKDRTGRSYVDADDVIYLLMPDRFANGDETNDIVKGMRESHIDRSYIFARHGGDLQGIKKHIDYLSDLGITAIWINPLLENDQPLTSYHGYAQTNCYRIDPRFGSNEDYRDLVALCHSRGIKVIKDMVYNHWGSFHPLVTHLPDSSWIHWHDEFTKSNFRASVLTDPYASKDDVEVFNNGWFDKHMPDMNQTDPNLSNYMIQNSLWWIEYANLDGFRIDTYAYSDQMFMARLDEAVRRDFPGFTLFGETWVQAMGVQAWFPQSSHMDKDFDSHLPGVTDFQLHFAVKDAFKENYGWTEGVSRIYYTLCQDGIYDDPNNNVVFLDNHDLSRFYGEMEGNKNLLKCGLGFLMTVRGIPMIYYGTELGFKSMADPDGKVREDFPGGWPEDTLNYFDPLGRQGEVAEIHGFTKQLINWRNSQEWIGSSSFMHFVPMDGVYIYFRYDDDHCVMVILNPENKSKTLLLDRFAERTNGYSTGRDAISRKAFDMDGSISINPESILILNLE